jgi:hypothetical protein
LAAARLMLERMGISPADLLDVAPARLSATTFAEYVPVVAAAVSPGTRRVYGSYWKRVVQAWGQRHIDEPVPSEIEQLRTQVQANAEVAPFTTMILRELGGSKVVLGRSAAAHHGRP